MKRFFLVLISVFSFFMNLNASDNRWDETVSLIFDSMKKPVEENINLEKNIDELKKIIGNNVLYQQINPFVVDILENFIKENPSVNNLYFTSTVFSLVVASLLIYNQTLSTEWGRILTPVCGALSVRTIDQSTQALINVFYHTKKYSRVYTHISNFLCFLGFCLTVNIFKAEHVPSVVLPIAGGFSIKVIDPILKRFDYSYQEDLIRSRYQSDLSAPIKRYYLSSVLTCYFAKKE
ncbi:MAG: hypothetical protein HEEMFOPI_01808 [Holosporales bacterium]